MKCPHCGADNDRVIDSRASQDGFSIRRRRECLVCETRFTTYERVEVPAIRVIKKDGGREPFAREKILSGLEKACWKRPLSQEQIESVVLGVEGDIMASGETEIPSTELGDMVMRRLKNLDQVAFVRFASVYRDFRDVRDFVDELRPILAEQQRNQR